MSPRVYVLLAATAAGSYGLGEADLGEARAATSMTREGAIQITLGAGAQATVESFVQSKVCPTVDADLELSGADVCDASADDWGVSLRVGVNDEGDRIVKMSARVTKAGNWVAGAPQ